MAASGDFHGVETIPSTVLRLSAQRSPAAETFGPTPSADATEPVRHASGPRYERLGMLGEGGMGRVDRVRDRDLLRDVAAKYLLADMRVDPEAVAQFLWEARVTAHLDHPNIVPVHELATTPEGEVFFTMKLARGRSLRDELEATKRAGGADDDVTLARRLRMFLVICNAVAFAHSRGILHRDLKPANVLIGDFGDILVSDWGLALPLDDVDADLRAIVPAELSRKSAGTPMYMSPEQVRGGPLDARSDIYSLGAILYELVALEHPIEADSLPSLLAKIVVGDVRPLASVRATAPRALAAIAHKALALAPEDRYATAKDLADDVEIALDGRTPAADDAPILMRAARYYMGRDPAFARMRVFHIDLIAGSSWLLGIGIGAWLASWLAAWRWAFFVAAAAAAIVPLRAWLRRRMPDPRA